MKKNKLSVLILTKNNEDLLTDTILSVKYLTDEIIVVDSSSKDKTIKIAQKYKAKVFNYPYLNLGKKRQFALSKAYYDWVLFLDTDERVSNKLQKEIKNKLSKKSFYNAYLIPFTNHYLSKRIRFGGENYKMIRLLKKKDAIITSSLVHEEIQSKSGNIGTLKGSIYHYSYRTLFQTFSKFTDYALRESKEKARKGEKTSIKKIFMYPTHMFWARFIKDKGYKDGFFRIPLDLGFAYMEFITYITLPFFKIFK